MYIELNTLNDYVSDASTVLHHMSRKQWGMTSHFEPEGEHGRTLISVFQLQLRIRF